MPCRRIVFSTFRGCMSFYTGSVRLGRPADVRCMTALPPKADVHPRSCYVAFVPNSGHRPGLLNHFVRAVASRVGGTIRPSALPVLNVRKKRGTDYGQIARTCRAA